MTGETTPSPAAQVRSQPSTRARVVGEDEALVIGGQALEAGPEQARDGEHALHREVIAAGLEHEAAALDARHDARPELDAGGAQLVGHGRARLLAEQRQRRVLGRHDRHDDVVVAHRARLARGHQRKLVDGQRPDRAGRHDNRELLAVALLDVAQQAAVDLRIATGPPGRSRPRRRSRGGRPWRRAARRRRACRRCRAAPRPRASSTSTTAPATSSAPASSVNSRSGTRCALPSANGSATAIGRYVKSGSGAISVRPTRSPARARRARSASSPATPPPAITMFMLTKVPADRRRLSGGYARRMIGPVAAAAVLEHVPRDADLIVAMANGEPVGLIDALEARSRAPRGSSHPPDARAARASLDRGEVRRAPAPRLLLPLARDAPLLLGRRLRSRPEPLLGDAASAAGGDQMLARAGGGGPARPPRLLQPRHQRRVRRGADRARAVLRRGQPADAAHPGPQPGPCIAAARLVRAGRAARGGRARGAGRARPRDRAADRRADPRRRDAAGRHRGDPERRARVARGPPRPRHPHGADLRRRGRPRRAGRRHGHAQVAAAEQGGDDVRARHHAALRLAAREPRGRDAARSTT